MQRIMGAITICQHIWLMPRRRNVITLWPRPVSDKDPGHLGFGASREFCQGCRSCRPIAGLIFRVTSGRVSLLRLWPCQLASRMPSLRGSGPSSDCIRASSRPWLTHCPDVLAVDRWSGRGHLWQRRRHGSDWRPGTKTMYVSLSMALALALPAYSCIAGRFPDWARWPISYRNQFWSDF